MRLGRERPRKELGDFATEFGSGLASMRLGRERPRKFAFGVEFSRLSKRFNEAGARTPQKEGNRGQRKERFQRFNEAGARTPQKGPVERALGRQIDTASMRLGRERPRKLERAPPRFAPPPRFNEAGARTPQKDREWFETTYSDIMLQ